MKSWQCAYVGIGSNLGDARTQVMAAFDALGRLPQTRLIARSRLYGSKPLGDKPQGDFVNAAAGLLTQLAPERLLNEMAALEATAGRPAVREHWGPRTLDLDLLVYGRERRDEPGLRLPHPGIVARNFVLYPLADIAPELRIPGAARVAQLAASLGKAGLWEL